MSPPSPSAPGGLQTTDHPFDVGWRERVLVLGSVAGVILIAGLLGLRFATKETLEIMGLLPITFFGVGKFLPLWGITGGSSLGPYELGAVIWALDTVTVLVFVYSFELFYRMPPLRRVLDRMHENMRLVLQVYPSFKRASIIGVILLVLFPVSGTGALAGSVIGLMLSMHRRSLILAVSFGGILGGMLMAFAAANFAGAVLSLRAVQSNPTAKYLIAGVGLSLLAALIFWVNRSFRKALAQAQEQGHAG